jgi:hypothetical protein
MLNSLQFKQRLVSTMSAPIFHKGGVLITNPISSECSLPLMSKTSKIETNLQYKKRYTEGVNYQEKGKSKNEGL